MSLWDISTAYLEARFRRFQSRESLTAWQDKQVERLLNYVLPRSEFYRERMQSVSRSNWRNLPVMTRTDMMTHFNRLNTAGVSAEDAMTLAIRSEQERSFNRSLGDLTVGLSSGTSGHRGLFLVSPKERSRWAGTILARVLPRGRWTLKPHCIAFFLRANSNLYQTVESKRVHFEYFDLLNSLEQHIQRLNSLQPTLLVGPPSLLVQLANAQTTRALTIAPERVVSVAEVLEPMDERTIQHAFGQTVHQVYQATEGLIATTCVWGTLHLMEDVVAVEQEIIDTKSGRFYPVITDLTRATQPMIRYRLDDVLLPRATPCPCGSINIAIEAVEGRADDVFFGEHSAGLIPIFPGVIRQTILLATETEFDYGLRQQTPTHLELYLNVVNAKDDFETYQAVCEQLRTLYKQKHCTVPQIQRIKNWLRDPLLKLRRIVRTNPSGELHTKTAHTV